MKEIMVLSLFLLLTACLGGYSPDSQFYKLQTIDDVDVVGLQKISIGIANINLPDYLEKPQIVVFEKASPKMKISEINRWGEPLSSMIQRTLAADISMYLPNSVVKSKLTLTEKFDYLVEVQIVRFDMIWDKEAVLEAWWYINNYKGNIIYGQKFLQHEKIGKSFSDFADAESILLGKMSKDIAQKFVFLKK